ncbi:MAG: hypothetical protein ACI9O6_003139 [Glaciecola sp.]|jgi:hypothetical protein
MTTIQSSTDKISMADKCKRNTKSLAVWTGAWLCSLALVAFGPKFLWDYGQVITVSAIAINILMGYKMIMANKQYLLDLDELQQRIHFVAMAFSLGISMVFGAVFGLIEAVRLVEFEPNPSSVLFVMGISYGVAMLVATRKYS